MEEGLAGNGYTQLWDLGIAGHPVYKIVEVRYWRRVRTGVYAVNDLLGELAEHITRIDNSLKCGGVAENEFCCW